MHRLCEGDPQGTCSFIESTELGEIGAAAGQNNNAGAAACEAGKTAGKAGPRLGIAGWEPEPECRGEGLSASSMKGFELSAEGWVFVAHLFWKQVGRRWGKWEGKGAKV